MPRRLIRLLCAALLLSHVVPTWGQSMLRRSELGINGGGMNYLGDLNGQSMLGKLSVAAGGVYRINFDNRWSMCLGASYGHVEGGNPDIIARRNLSFRSFIGEGWVRAEFNFLPFGRAADDFSWTPYIFGGLGFFAFNPQAQYKSPVSGTLEWYDLQPLGTEGQGLAQYPDRTKYSLIQGMLPFGLGIRYIPFEFVTFAVEYGFRKTWTDYIDDVSTTYVDGLLFSSDITSRLADRSGEVEPGYVNAPGIKRGDDSLDDWYAYLNLSITVRMDKILFWVGKKRCDLK